VRTWSPAWVYVAFIVDVYSQRIVAWHASPSKATDLVMTPLRMAIWQRDHDGHPIVAAELIHHIDPLNLSNRPRSGSPSTSTSRASSPPSGLPGTPTTVP